MRGETGRGRAASGGFVDLPEPPLVADAGPSGVNDPAPRSVIEPVQLSLDDEFRFRCRKGIPCFNRCCRNADIMLAPYDIVRLKRRLGLSAREFIDSATTDYAMDGDGMPGLKLAHSEGSDACVFLTDEGCAVYEDRPSACRYYALGLLALRKQDAREEEDTYFAVKEDHCLGHFEDRVQTVRQYREEQGVDEYDRMNREWRQIVLKKRSAGPGVGSPSARSLELFFLASYDLDGFRAFVSSPAFRELFDLDPAFHAQLRTDDEELLQFAYRYLKQALFGEITIPLHAHAAAERGERFRRKRAALASAQPGGEQDAANEDEA